MAASISPVVEAFVSDGCTGFFDVWRSINLSVCCYAHDLSWYSHPGDWLAWWLANVELARCFAGVGAFELVIPALVAVATIGALLFSGVLKKKRI